MSLTASALITAAKQRAYGSIGQQKVSDAMLLAELSSQDAMIFQEVSQLVPDLLATSTGNITVTFAQNSGGYTLTAGTHYRDFAHSDGQGNFVPLTMLRRQYQDYASLVHPAGMLSLAASGAGVFYPMDPSGNRWTLAGTRPWFDAGSSHLVKYSYVAVPTVLTTLASTVASPDMAREILVNALVLAIFLSVPKVPVERVQVLMEQLKTARQNLTFQLHKFVSPAGSRPSGGAMMSETDWVDSQI